VSAPPPGVAADEEPAPSPTEKRASFPKLPEPVPLPRFSAADDLRAAIALWIAWLSGERRSSAHTIAAYGRDLVSILDFLTEHLGARPSLAALDQLRPADFRAYLARRAADGIERSSLARTLSVLRNFVRFLQRRGPPRQPRSRHCARPNYPPRYPRR
jgi:integrase/recombinase XerC